MTKRHSFLTRSLALVLALVMVLSNANMGLRAFAAEGETITDAQMLINCYGLSDAEAALLNSGYLTRVEYPVAAVSDEDLTIEVSEKTITAVSADSNWTPVAAEVLVDGQPQETVALNDGVGTFAYEGDDFTIRVLFAQQVEVPADDQEALLNAGANINVALATLEAAKAADEALGIVAEALPLLESANNAAVDLGASIFTDAAKTAFDALLAQKDTNGGELTVVQTNSTANLASMAQKEERSSHKAIVEETASNLQALNDGLAFDELATIDEELVGMLQDALSEAIEALDEAAAADWNSMDAVNLTDSVDYEDLASKAEGLTATYTASDKLDAKLYFKTWINVETTQNISVGIALDLVVDNMIYESKEATGFEVQVALDATEEEILAAVDATGIEETTVASWEDYVAEHFERTVVVEGGKVTITYAPVNYTVSYGYQDAEQYPYGYVITLEKPETELTEYDYTVNGEAYTEETVLVDGDLTIDRDEVTARNVDTTLYAEIANAFAKNDTTKEILSSGAIEGDKKIRVYAPDFKGVAKIDKDGTLSAPDFDASFNGESWEPYSYGEGLFFNGANEIYDYEGGSTVVSYRLDLGMSSAEVEELLALVAELKADADGQKSALDSMAFGNEGKYYTDMGSLNTTLLRIIVGSLEDGEVILNANPAKNAELTSEFINAFTTLQDSCEANKQLKLYNMLGDYRNGGGLMYYYQNAEAFRAEVKAMNNALAGVSGTADKDAALSILLDAFSMPNMDVSGYKDKIANLAVFMADVDAKLSPINSAIITSDEDALATLVSALSSSEAVETAEAEPAYMERVTTALDERKVNITVTVNVEGVSAEKIVMTADMERETVVTTDMVADLEAKIAAAFAELAAGKEAYYTGSCDTDLDALVGTAMTDSISATYSYKANSYTVKIVENGAEVASTTLTILAPGYKLPNHDKAPAWVYTYTVNGNVYNQGVTVKLVEDVIPNMSNGVCTLTREESNQGTIDLLNVFADMGENWVVTIDSEGVPTALEVTVDANSNLGLMDFASDLLLKCAIKYTNIDLAGESFIEPMTVVNDKGKEEVISKLTVQSLVNAILADTGFTSERVIALGQNNGGLLLNTTIQLAQNDGAVAWDLPFTIKMNGVPAKLVTVANGLDAVKNYFSFQSSGANARSTNGGYLDVDLTLPQPVYEVYLSALLATNELDKTDMNAINDEIAFNFLYKYFDELIEDKNVTAQSYQNTIDMLLGEATDLTGKDFPNIDVAKYSKYYDLMAKQFQDDNVTVDTANGVIALNYSDEAINELLEILGVNLEGGLIGSTLDGFYIQELEDGAITCDMIAELTNTDISYEAMLVDSAIRGMSKVQAAKKVYDFTNNLSERAKTMGAGVVMLLSDVGDVTFNGTTIIDLNGYTMNSLTGNGKVVVIDSNLDKNGTIKSVKGNVTLVDGTYTQNVDAFLPDGYVQRDNGNVENVAYRLEGSNGNYNIIVDTDFMFSEDIEGYLPAVHYMALDLAVDLVLNYYSSAALSIDGNEIYNLAIDDLVAIVGSDANSDKVAALVDDLLACIRFNDSTDSVGGIDDFINDVVADLLDLDGIAASIRSQSVVGDYTFTTKAWSVDVSHNAAEDYVYAGIVPNDEITKTHTYSLFFEVEDGALSDSSSLTNNILGKLDYLNRIIDGTFLTLDIDQPYRNGSILEVEAGAVGMLSLDFSHDVRYAKALGIVLEYFGIVEDGSYDALKASIDDITIADVVNGLRKSAEEKVDFAVMAEKVKIDLTDAELAKIEAKYDELLEVVDKILAKLNLTENERALGGLKRENNWYRVSADFKAGHDATIAYKGYGVHAVSKLVEATVQIRLFPADDCLWGDANHDGIVSPKDATLVLQYAVGAEINGYFCTLKTDVNADGVISPKDATLILQHSVGTITKFPAEK